MRENAIRAHAAELVEGYDVRTPSVMALAGNLSGGNQQKMVVAHEFSRPVKLLIAAQRTREGLGLLMAGVHPDEVAPGEPAPIPA